MGLNRAVDLIAQKRAGGGRGGRGAVAKPLRELGEHPESGKPVAVYSGRYGPYVKHDKTNATLPKDLPPETVTLEQAIELVDAKAAKGSVGKTKRAGAKSAKKKRQTAEADDLD